MLDTACFKDAFVNPPAKGPDYDQFKPVVGTHCLGTNHQSIDKIERVVFLGDSVTVGTPPSLPAQYYRSLLADALANKFQLAKPNLLWQVSDPLSGKALLKEAGAFASCSKWGARNDDLMPTQLPDCFPQDSRNEHRKGGAGRRGEVGGDEAGAVHRVYGVWRSERAWVVLAASGSAPASSSGPGAGTT